LLTHAIIDNIAVAYILIDTSYLTYSIISSKFVKKSNLEHTKVTLQQIIGVAGKESYIKEAAKLQINVDRHVKTM
jgi:hypothetical protein